MKKKEGAKEYLKKQWNLFITSFKTLDRRILYVAIYNLLFVLLGFFLFSEFRKVLIKLMQPLSGLTMDHAKLESVEFLSQNQAILKGAYTSIIVYAVLFLIILFVGYVIYNLLAWSSITGKNPKKINPRFAGKFLLMGFIWIALWVAATYFITSSMRPDTVLKWIAGIAVVYAHLTTIMYISYFKRKKIKKAMKQPFKTNLAHFAVPYVFAAVVFVAVNILLKVFQSTSEKTFMFVSTIIMLLYAAWIRIYIYSFAKDLI